MAVCPTLAVGEAFTYPSGTASFCLGGTASGQEYTIVTATNNLAAPGLTLTGTNITTVIGGPSPNISSAQMTGRMNVRATVQEDHKFEHGLRRSEQDLLARTPASAFRAAPSNLSMIITPGVPAVGQLMTINTATASACSSPDDRTGRVVHVGDRIIIMADTLNPSGGFTAADYESIALEFDTLVWPRMNPLFGSEADIDSNARVIAFYTRAVNELTPPGSSSFVGGFFFARDLFPTGTCPSSNYGEIFYMLVPDPSGTVNTNVRTTAFVRERTVATLAHEYQHLINASRRMYVLPGFASAFEEVWLNEGLSHIAEEEVFYEATGLAAGSNLGASVVTGPTQTSFMQYAVSNFGRFREFLLRPTLESPIRSNDVLATRGAAWAFLRYLSDRTSTSMFTSLLNAQQTGLTNLNAVLGSSALDMMRDWQISLYADDIGAAQSQYQTTSWNFRSVYSTLNYGAGFVYPLVVRDPATDVADTFSLTDGSSAYSRLRVTSNNFATFTLQQSGGVPAANVRVSVIRRQ